MRCHRWFGFLVACVLILAFGVGGVGQTPVQKQKAQQLFVQANQYEKEKKYKQAAESMRDALKLVPKNDAFLLYAAKVEVLAGNHADSLEHALQAAKINLKNPAAVIQVMKSAVEAQDFDVAKEYADKVVFLGAKRVGQSSFDEAKGLLASIDTRKADKLHNDAVLLALERKFDRALEKTRAALALTPKSEQLASYQAELEILAAQDVIDQHALKANSEAEKSIESLADYLAQPAKSDRDKTRAIYRWITDRIAYNAEDFLAGRRGDNSPEGVLKNRKAVCAGYANLFDALGKKMGLTVVTVGGYAKGVGYMAGADVAGSNHAWNAVQLDGQWRLIDSTWGAGNLNGKEFVKRFDEFFYLVSAERMIFSHFPDEPKWQLLTPAVPQKEFQQWPKVDRSLFEYGLTPTDVRKHLQDNAALGLVNAFPRPTVKLTLRKAPIEKQLKPGEHAFRVEAAGIAELALINNNKFTHLKKTGNVFEGSVFANKGELQLGAKMLKQDDNSYAILLKYVVE